MIDRSQIQDVIDRGGGVLRLEPCWVPRSFMHPGRRLRLHPDDLYAFGAHRGGINERWFSSTTNADNGPGTPADEGLSYVRLAERPAPAAEGRGRRGRRSAARSRNDGAREGLEPALQVLRQHGTDPASHAPARRACAEGRPPRQARGVLLSAAVQPDRQQLSAHLHGARARHDEGPGPALPRELEPRRQRHHLLVAGVSSGARQRLADRSGHPARAGFAADLRAAGQQRRVRDVPVGGRRPHHAVGAAREGRSA